VKINPNSHADAKGSSNGDSPSNFTQYGHHEFEEREEQMAGKSELHLPTRDFFLTLPFAAETTRDLCRAIPTQSAAAISADADTLNCWMIETLPGR
jgi:hypothetical protein